MGWLKRNCFHGAVCELLVWRHGLCQDAVPKMPGCWCSAPIWRYLCGFVDTFVMWGCFHPMCQKERGVLFLRPSRVAHVSARHAHLCRSSAGLVSHRFVSYRTASTAFLEKLFYVFWGGYFRMLLRWGGFRWGDAGVSD